MFQKQQEEASTDFLVITNFKLFINYISKKDV